MLHDAVSLGAELLKHIVGIYIRLSRRELERLREHPDILPKYDPRVALTDGRGLDLGRAWEELAVFLDGGVKLPDVGPTVGETPIKSEDARATWSYIEPERVTEWAVELAELSKKEFDHRYSADPDDTQDSLPGSRTGKWGDRAAYLWGKLRALAEHFTLAAEQGEGMLVRIGERM